MPQPGLAPAASDRHGALAMKIQSTTHGLPRREGGTSQDACRVLLRDGRVIAALADGVGSSQEGGAAAQRAVDMIVDYYVARPQAWSPRRALTEFVTQINRILHQEALLRHGSPELLCTLCVARRLVMSRHHFPSGSPSPYSVLQGPFIWCSISRSYRPQCNRSRGCHRKPATGCTRSWEPRRNGHVVGTPCCVGCIRPGETRVTSSNSSAPAGAF